VSAAQDSVLATRIKAVTASTALTDTIEMLRAAGVMDAAILNALAGVCGALIGKIAQPEFERRLAADFAQRVRGAIRR
jgi:hypothetical protein